MVYLNYFIQPQNNPLSAIIIPILLIRKQVLKEFVLEKTTGLSLTEKHSHAPHVCDRPHT